MMVQGCCFFIAHIYKCRCNLSVVMPTNIAWPLDTDNS